MKAGGRKLNPPLVTGISPKEGPPGTRVTIRGENLGLDARDVTSLKICGVECVMSAEWRTASKINARTGPGKGKGDIIVTTRSGGKGGSNVGFRGYFVQTGPLQESAVWVNESQWVPPTVNRSSTSTPLLISQVDDPLGISDEGNQGKFPESDLTELFPDGSGDTSLENFVPTWFLLENHHGTGFDDLKAGLAYLKRKSAQRSEGPKAFVKTNLGTITDCQDVLADVHKKLMEDDTRENHSCITDKLEKLLKNSNTCADSLFQDVLGRKDSADATRNALNVLHRFKFLFYLPLNIERNIKKGDYDIVINDYARVKSLFADTDVQVFKKVLDEVEAHIKDFQDILKDKLMELPSNLEEQKRLIRFLVELEYPGDPAWECLNNQQQWMVNLLTDCKDHYHTKDKTKTLQGKGLYTTVHQLSVPTAKQSSHIAKHGSLRSTDQVGWRYRTPQKVLFVEELTDIMTESFPDLWKLGQAYFTGTLIEGDKDKKIDTTKHSKFKRMMSDVVNLFSNLTRAAFIPESLENLPKNVRAQYGNWSSHETPPSWLPHCVRFVRMSVNGLLAADLPSDSQEVLSELSYDMRNHCLTTLLKQAVSDIESLHTREVWHVEVDDINGGTTQLPLLFENIINETVHHLHEVVSQLGPKEVQIFSQRTVQRETTDLCIKLFSSFALCLDKLAFEGDALCTKEDNEDYSEMEDPVPTLDKRLIVMLSNCNHVIQTVIGRVTESLERQQYPETNKVLQEATKIFKDLDERLFGAYIEEKSNPVIGSLEQNMYSGKYSFKQFVKPTGVRSYLKCAMMSIIEIHAEVFSISPILLSRILCQVIENTIAELSRLFQCVHNFNNNGGLQARLEILALQEAVEIYKTEEASVELQKALNILPQLRREDRGLLEELLNRFKSNMKFQLMCFRSDTLLHES